MGVISFLRALRRRWLLLVVAALIGAAGGYAWSLRSDGEPDDDGRVYYAQTHTLVVSDGGAVGDLRQTALFVTAGDTADAAATRLERPVAEVAPRVQTVTDVSLGTLAVSGVGETPDEAVDLTDAFVSAILGQLTDAEVVARTALVDEAQRDVDRLTSELAELDRSIETATAAAAAVTATPTVDPSTDGTAETGTEPDAGGPTTEQQRRLEDLTRERFTKASELSTALAALDEARQGTEAVAPLQTLQMSEPYEITEAAFLERVAAGQRGQANYDSGSDAIPDDRADARSGDGRAAASAAVTVPVGVIAGLLVAAAGVLAFTRIDPRIHTKRDVEKAFRLPVLATVPEPSRRARRRGHELLTHTDPEGPVAEAYRALRSAVVYARESETPVANGQRRDGGRHRAQVVMVTSDGPAAGKTTVTANLAAALAEAGQRVLALNCDFRRPRLVELLEGSTVPRTVSETVVEGVVMIGHVTDRSIEGNPAAVVSAQQRVIARARRRFDVILLDTAPLLATNDATELLAVTDLVVLVARAGKTTREGAETVRQLLDRREARIAGVVLLGADDMPDAKGYYHYSRGTDRVARSGPKGQRRVAPAR